MMSRVLIIAALAATVIDAVPATKSANPLLAQPASTDVATGSNNAASADTATGSNNAASADTATDNNTSGTPNDNAVNTDRDASVVVGKASIERISALASITASQLEDEDNANPFLHLPLTLLQEHQRKVQHALDTLLREEKLFAGNESVADQSDATLMRMLESVRETSSRLSLLLASRGLPVVASQEVQAAEVSDESERLAQLLRAVSARDFKSDLAGVPALFGVDPTDRWRDPDGSVLHRLDQLLDQATLVDILTAASGKVAPPSAKTVKTTEVEAPPVTGEATGEKSLRALAEEMSEAATQMNEEAARRAILKGEDAQKTAAAASVWQGLEKVLPILDMHMLRFGRTPKSTAAFTKDAIEKAYRQVESLRDRIIKEQTLRELQARIQAAKKP